MKVVSCHQWLRQVVQRPMTLEHLSHAAIVDAAVVFNEMRLVAGKDFAGGDDGVAIGRTDDLETTRCSAIATENLRIEGSRVPRGRTPVADADPGRLEHQKRRDLEAHGW